MKKVLGQAKYIQLFGLLSFTLGLAPFYPEPHILGKLRWVWGGAVGMGPMDYFDLILHGTPWLLFLLSASFHIACRFKEDKK